MPKFAHLILILIIPALAQETYSPYICNSKVEETCLTNLIKHVNKKYAVIEVESNNDGYQIGDNLRNIIVERIMELGNFKKVFLSVPDSNKADYLLISTRVADFNCSDPTNGFAVGFMFGLAGAAAMAGSSQGTIAVKTQIIQCENDSVICSTGFYSRTSRGTSSGSVPYKSVVCIAEAITKYANSIFIHEGDNK